MADPYVDTLIIDCNRKGSEEYNVPTAETNSALYTCKQGSGIKLNPGDEVSVHSAFINERGNEDNMEFKGTRPKGSKTYTLTKTNLYQVDYTTKYVDRDLTDQADRTDATEVQSGADKVLQGPAQYKGYGDPKCLYYNDEYGGYQRTIAINQEETFEVKDNEVNFQISYYKTANGEGYLQLPRRFDCPDPSTPSGPAGGAGGNNMDSWSPSSHPELAKNLFPKNDPFYYLYTAYDGNSLIYRGDADNILVPSGNIAGRAKKPEGVGKDRGYIQTGEGVGDECYLTGRCRSNPVIYSQVKADWQKYQFGKAQKPGPGANNLQNPRYVGLEYQEDDGGKMWKFKQDNSRYTMYVKQNTNWTKEAYNTRADTGTGIKITDTDIPTLEGRKVAEEFHGEDANFTEKFGKDPAVRGEWIRYQEIKNVKIDPGYNTTDEVSEQFTDQLNKTQPLEKVKAELRDRDVVNVSVKSRGECFRPFHATTHSAFGRNNFLNYHCDEGKDVGGKSTCDDQNIIDYETAYHYIGVKRPDFWDAGRQLHYDTLLYPGNLASSNSTFAGTTANRTYPHLQADLDVGATNPIITSIPWTKANVDKYLIFFNAQIKYPELFDYDYVQINTYQANPPVPVKYEMSVDTQRFLHIDVLNSQHNAGSEGLGSDNYTPGGVGSFKEARTSYPIFFDYIDSQKDIEYSDDLGLNGPHAYGIFQRRIVNGSSFITFTCDQTKQGDYLFYNAAAGDANVKVKANTKIGYDLHFSAYGNACIMPYAGYLNADYDGQTLLQVCDSVSGETQVMGDPNGRQFKSTSNPHNIYPFIRDIYLGANQLELAFEEGKFFLHQLHTPEYIGNTFSAGKSADNPVVGDADTQVYKINKRLGATNFCPDMVPYQPATSTDTSDIHGGKIEISNFNHNLEKWATFDAKTGIFIEDFGIDKDDWDNSLWKMLGFSYKQFDLSNQVSDRQTRLNDLVNLKNIGAITTNANITTGDIPTYPRNTFGAEQFTLQLPGVNYPLFEGGATAFADSRVVPYLPAISEVQKSVKIIAETLPIKMKNPYYLIKSDIIQDTKYCGLGADDNQGYSTGQMLPIVGVVNKENGFGDYYFQVDTQMAFTITKPTMISSITTSIHDPDMSLARVDEDCCVIYKVKKQNTGNYNIGSELLQKNQKAK
tara:strand:- start:231 stop:3701 length:3471 start_codon:yes stop_codon:yes gene_type:complete